jgi:signal transduction histidine kinase
VRWLRSFASRLSITARITLGSFAIALLVGVIAVLGIRAGVGAIVDNATLTLLRDDAEQFEHALQTDPADVDAVPLEDQYVALVAPDGRVTLSTLPHSLRPHGRVALTDGEATAVVRTPQHDYLVRSKAVSTSDGVWHVISARDQDSNNLVLDRLSLALIVGMVALVAVFTLASFILARTALRPVNDLRRQADELTRARANGTGGAELLKVPPVRDELAALAVTLNGLIADLRASADREKQLVSDASHELRTPLAVLRGELELAELDSGDPDALLNDVRQAHQTVLRLSTLATNLLELSRIDAHGQRGSSGWAQLEDELAAAIDRMRQMAAVRRIECVIDFEVTTDAPPHGAIALSPGEFGRVVDNLIANSITAIGAAKGAGMVTARLSHTEASVELSIVDDGPGMPADFVPIALDRFTRVDSARNTTTGSGLGLAIVAGLVDAARGGIHLSSSAHEGLTVDITLPLG